MIRGINYIDNTHYECGMIEDTYTNIYIYDKTIGTVLPAPNELKSSPYIRFSQSCGWYVFTTQWKSEIALSVKCRHIYPYQKINRVYGAADHLKTFTKSVNNYLKQLPSPKLAFEQLCPFTFGLEYETSTGVIPEEECFMKGLIPLRDGSITGNEYTTTVLNGNKGLQLIHEQINILNQYTEFNKDCAVHIHFGKYPLQPNAILILNNLCAILTDQLLTVTPAYTFYTHRYKANGKDYCKPLDWYNSFEQMYKDLTSMTYYGDLHQPHPADPNKQAKWNIHTRYKMCNFINLLCYNGGKTVEFRFLKPTKNEHLLYFWLYMLNAIMLFALKNQHLSPKEFYCKYSSICLTDIINAVYPVDIALSMNKAIQDLSIIRQNQRNNGDNCGEQIHFENNFKLSTNLINL